MEGHAIGTVVRRAVLGALVLGTAIVSVGCSSAQHTSSPTKSTTSVAAGTTSVRAADARAIGRYIDQLNVAYRKNPRRGYVAEAESDYYVDPPRFTRARCIAFWVRRDGGYQRAEREPMMRTLTATPTWILPEGKKPPGRVYALTLKVLLWPPGTFSSGKSGGTRSADETIHLSVLPDGKVEQFLPCQLPKDA